MSTKKSIAKKAVKKVIVRTYDAQTVKRGRIKGYTVDVDRVIKHGIARRSKGTIGGALWAIFDKLAHGKPAQLQIAAVKEHKLVAGYNVNKVSIEFYIWRRFCGVRGRGKKQKVA